jgi:exonuclease SbcC
MKYLRLRAHNMGPFKDLDLDLTQIRGPLVAFVGGNGEGKTTALELFSGSHYRRCPTRGKLAALATGRDSFVETQLCNGKSYTVRQVIDAHTGQGETLIQDADGAPVLEGTKVSKADKWLAEHFPSAEVLYSSSVAVQGRRGLLDMESSERKSVLLQALRIGYLEELAEKAREKARAAKVHVDTLRARLADVPQVDLEGFADAVSRAKVLEAEAAELTRAARVALDRAKAAAADQARAAELAEQRRAAQKRLDTARAQLADVEVRIANNRRLLDEGPTIRQAVAEAAALDTQIAAKKEELSTLARALGVAIAEERSAQGEMRRTTEASEAIKRRIRDVHARMTNVATVYAAVHDLEDFATQGEPQRSLDAIGSLENRIETLEAFALRSKDQRIDGLRHGLDVISHCEDNDAPFQSWAGHTLAEDDKLLESERDAPSVLQGLRTELAESRTQLRALELAIGHARTLAARLPEIQRATSERETLSAELTAALDLGAQASQAYAVAVRARAQATEVEVAAERARDALIAERAKLSSVLSRAEHLAQAEAKIEAYEEQLPALRETVTHAEAELAGLPEIIAQSVDLTVHERKVGECERAEKLASTNVAKAQEALARAKENAAKRGSLSAQMTDAETELSDWTRLGQDLGRDGLQALEIDGAIPEINTIANDLLSSCHGSRFTVDIRAERLHSDGKTSLEGLELRVIDTVRGRDALAESYSGGECVIVGEALALALTTIACRRSGESEPTLIRDESGAALDEENGRAYIAMLRMAARQIGASHVLFVSHQRELAELADARVVFADGRVEVQG